MENEVKQEKPKKLTWLRMLDGKIKLVNIFFSLLLWVFAIWIFYLMGLLKDVDPNLLLIVHLGAFFFSLTTSPVTWKIKGLGIEIGSNTPNHFQVDEILEERGQKRTIIIRDYDNSCDVEKIKQILSDDINKKLE